MFRFLSKFSNISQISLFQFQSSRNKCFLPAEKQNRNYKMTASPPSSFKLGLDYSFVLWAGFKTPLVDEQGNVVKTTSAASPTLMKNLRVDRKAFVEPPPTSSHTEEVLQYADDDDDVAACEVLESPMGLLDLLEEGGYSVPSSEAKRQEQDEKDGNEDDENRIPLQLRGIDSLYILTPGNFASSDFYLGFVQNLRKMYPTMGVLVLGHAGIQSSDRNHRVGFSLRHYICLNAHFIYEIALSRNCETALRQMAGAGNVAASSTAATSSSSSSTARHPRLILGAHSVGGYILTKALEQVTQIPRWLEHMNLHRVCLYAPVIQHFEAAPAGDGAGKWVSKLGAGIISYGAVLPFWLLPLSARESIIESFTGLDSVAAAQAARTVRPSSVWNCLQLARTAFRDIKELNVNILHHGLGKKLFVYYVQNDGWVPQSYVDTFVKECPKATVVMEADEKIGHSCCVTAPEFAVKAFPLV